MITLKNGQVYIDGGFQTTDILIKDDKIIKIGQGLNKGRIIDCTGQIVIPGLVDCHVHLREPGFTNKETIKTGTSAAAKGGYTTVFAMPNVNPNPDTLEKLDYINQLIEKDAIVEVIQIANITDNKNNLSEMEKMAPYTVGFSNDGKSVADSKVMLDAMKMAKKINRAIIAHVEDESLAKNGVIRESEYSRKQGLIGIPEISETVQLARDLLLASITDVHYHMCHISSALSLDLIKMYKQMGTNVTVEVTPHHLLLTIDDIKDDGNYKMNPPLGSIDDQNELIEGIKSGAIDIIATDHAPHTTTEKSQGLKSSPFGIVGLETAFPLMYTNLVKNGVITLEHLVRLMSINPRLIFNLKNCDILVGNIANISVFDITHEKAIDKNEFLSMGKNMPYQGMICSGWNKITIYEGKIVYEAQ